MRIRQMIVRAVNKIRGVDAYALLRTRSNAHVSISSLALYLNIPLMVISDWEFEFAAIPKDQYEKAMKYLHECLEEREKLERKEFIESPVWRD